MRKVYQKGDRNKIVVDYIMISWKELETWER